MHPTCAVPIADLPAADVPAAVTRVCHELHRLGHVHAPVWLTQAARTAQEAAQALGVEIGQIAKSVMFRREEDGRTVLVVTSGDRRVDESKVAAQVGTLGRADAKFIKAKTGFSIGGVSPVAHIEPPLVLVDQELLRFELIWAAAGHPNAVFALAPDRLSGWLGGAPVLDVTVAPAAP